MADIIKFPTRASDVFTLEDLLLVATMMKAEGTPLDTPVVILEDDGEVEGGWLLSDICEVGIFAPEQDKETYIGFLIGRVED